MASEDIAKQLNAALEECARLREENKRLRSLIAIPEEKPNAPVAEGLSLEEKVTLFRSLFRGREDVYPMRWEARTGKSGYSPACYNEWKRPLCVKPQIRCSECQSWALIPTIGSFQARTPCQKEASAVVLLFRSERSCL